MWYQNEDDKEEGDKDNDQSALSIGPFDITSRELFVSIMSNLIVIPPVLLMTYFFVKSDRTTKNETPYDVITIEESSENENKGWRDRLWKRLNHLPGWCVYIGYALVVLTVVSCAFFTIMFAFMWGKGKAEKWLTTFILSFIGSVIFIQPLKVRLTFIYILYIPC